MSEIVPIGKYKGQPIEIMLSDQGYCEWIAAQPWFKEKYRNVYNIIVGGVQEEADTPEHNAMQIKFLDDDYCRAVVFDYCVGQNLNDLTSKFIEDISRKQFESESGFDVVFYASNTSFHSIEIKPVIGDDYPKILRQIKSQRDRRLSIVHADLEKRIDRRKDKILYHSYFLNETANDRFFLVYKTFNSSVITEEQFYDYFLTSGIHCIKEQFLDNFSIKNKELNS